MLIQRHGEQRESPSDFLPEKLAPNYLGPYMVVRQEKNDVTVEHVVLRTQHVLHVDRLKPFIGPLEEAVLVAKADQNQVFIVSLNYFTGNPHLRSSMTFSRPPAQPASRQQSAEVATGASISFPKTPSPSNSPTFINHSSLLSFPVLHHN